MGARTLWDYSYTATEPPVGEVRSIRPMLERRTVPTEHASKTFAAMAVSVAHPFNPNPP